MPTPYKRVRVTVSTVRRIENYTLLLATLKTSDGMTIADVSDLLHKSPSGARKYMKPLRETGAIHITGYEGRRENFEGFPIYSLVSDEAAQAFMELIGLPESKFPARARKEAVNVSPGRRVHILEDDIRYNVDLVEGVCRRDPFALPVEFFARQAVA